MDGLDFIALNFGVANEAPSRSELSEVFTMTAVPSTTLWRQPRSQSTATAPMLLTHLKHPFIVAEVTVSAVLEMEWDQSGLVIFSEGAPARSCLETTSPRERLGSWCSNGFENCSDTAKWVKAGLEFCDGCLNVSSVVATKDSGADWSLCPIYTTSDSSNDDPDQLRMTSLRIKFERTGDGLWIWYLVPDSPIPSMQEWRKLREVMGFFIGIETKENVWVGCYASRPTAAILDDNMTYRGLQREGLVVDFEDLEIL